MSKISTKNILKKIFKSRTEKKVKNLPEDNKIKIIETSWSIIYSDKDIDIYEANLMRRLAGLLYIDNKTMGDIKNKIQKENS